MIGYVLGAAGVAGAALLGLALRKKKAASSAAAKSKALTDAYAKGNAEGQADAKADSGKPHNPRPTLNEYTDPALQTQFMNGYNDGYEKLWVAPAATDVTKESTPSAGGKDPKTSAYNYGCSRGSSSGFNDAKAGYASSWDYNLKTPGSLKRQAESGDPAAYRDGYKNCYIKAYASAKVGESMGDVLSDWEAGREGTFISGNAAHIGAMALPREQLDAMVKQTLVGIDRGSISREDGYARAVAFERRGMKKAANAIRSMLAVRQARTGGAVVRRPHWYSPRA